MTFSSFLPLIAEREKVVSVISLPSAGDICEGGSTQVC